MLILSRKVNESIVIDGRIVVKVLRIDKDTVKLGIQAPTELPVHREEIYNVIQKNKQASMNAGRATIPKSPMAQVTPIADPPVVPLDPIPGKRNGLSCSPLPPNGDRLV